MKTLNLMIKNGRITGIENPNLNPILPDSDLSYVNNEDLYQQIHDYIRCEHPKLENKISFEDGVMKHSNPYLAVATDMFLKKYHPDFRIARQIDLEKNLEMFKGKYIDSGLALRNLTGDNNQQALYLFEQLKKRGYSDKDFLIWFDLRGLELTKDLNFNLTDESSYKTNADCLNWDNGTSFSKINDFGLPKEIDNNSSRQIWTDKNYALSRCSLGRVSYLDTLNSDFSYSVDYGRVVLVRAKGSQKNLGGSN